MSPIEAGDHVVTCLSVFCGTCDNWPPAAPCLHGHTVKMLPGASNGCPVRARETQSVPQPVVVRRADAGARKRLVKIPKDLPLELRR